MSCFTTAVLASVGQERARLRRDKNFLYLHTALQDANRMRIFISHVAGPMVYPFWCADASLRKRLIASRIYVANYWAEVLEDPHATPVEKELAGQLIPLPMDQRYDLRDMTAVLDVVDSAAA